LRREFRPLEQVSGHLVTLLLPTTHAHKARFLCLRSSFSAKRLLVHFHSLLFGLFCSVHLILFSHHLVGSFEGIIVLIDNLSLFLVLHISFHFTLVDLAHGLGATVVSFSGHAGALLDTVLRHDTEVSLLFELFSVAADLHHLRDNADIFAAV